jgi:hypothetical protein
MLRAGSIILSIWSGVNLLLAFLILTSIIFFKSNAPILVMVFQKPEISRLDARAISAVNALAILYNSCSAALSVLALFIIWSSLINGSRWAFWALLITIGFVEVMAFIASAAIGNQRWQVNVLLSILYVVGIVLAGYSISNQ